MARPKKVDTNTLDVGSSDKDDLAFLSSLSGFQLLKDTNANMLDYISTGSYAFNRMISGSYFKGIPSNRLVVFHGPSGTGKSLLAGCCAREAQKKGYTVVYFDSENAIDEQFCANLGIDIKRIVVYNPETIAEFRNKSIELVKTFREKRGKDAKLMLICDSIGNLLGTKERNDITEGKEAQDMGQRAKELRSCARALTNFCGKHNIPLIAINHSYDQAAANPMSAPVRKMSGGEGFVYACTCIINLNKSVIREETVDGTGTKKKLPTGVRLRAKTDKNRIVQEGLDAEIYLSFKTGINKYYGLVSDAIEHGFMEKQGTRYYVKHLEKSFFEAHLFKKENRDAVWGPILDDLNKCVENTIKFHNIEQDEIEGCETGESSDDSDDDEVSDAE
jgi:recombination protein RecA